MKMKLTLSPLAINLSILAIVTVLIISLANFYTLPFPATWPLWSMFAGVQLGTAFSKNKTGFTAFARYLGGLIFGVFICVLFFCAISR